MYEFIIMTFILPITVTSIFFGKISFHQFLNKRIKNTLYAYTLVGAVYIVQEYVLLKLSFDTLGYIYFQYAIAVSIFFMGQKRLGYFLFGLTPLVSANFLVANSQLLFNKIGFIFAESLLFLLICILFKRVLTNYWGFVFAFSTIMLSEPVLFDWGTGLDEDYDLLTLLFLMLGILMLLGIDYTYRKYEYLHKKELEQIEFESTHDNLTCLLNYASFSKQLEILKKTSTNELVICALDLDHFKKINDIYGHLEGNKVLHHFAQILQQNCDQNFGGQIKLYRFGGEEFCALITGYSLEQSAMIFTELENSLKQKPFITENGQNIYLSFSGGLAVASGNLEIHNAVRQADVALYTAKQHGRGKIWIN